MSDEQATKLINALCDTADAVCARLAILDAVEARLQSIETHLEKLAKKGIATYEQNLDPGE